MAATTTPQTTSIIARLEKDLPSVSFKTGNDFLWSPSENTIYYANTSDTTSLLHEVAHAMLNHHDYTRDIRLLQMERDAWSYASSTLSGKYGVVVDKAVAEDMLDSYRNWLHSRSLCPNCQATGLQTATKIYTCIACDSTWRVNEARSCALRRYPIHK